MTSDNSSVEYQATTTPLVGLVLAGGKSTRMGADKGLIDWHGKPQRYYAADLLAAHCSRVYISCRDDQVAAIEAAGYTALADSSAISGQYGAIISALQTHPESVFLVLACDIPLVDDRAIAELVNQRDPLCLATAYQDAENGLPEPLIAIWEPKSLAMLRKRATEGVSCPRKALILSQPQVKLVMPSHPISITNVNTPPAAEIARERIKAAA